MKNYSDVWVKGSTNQLTSSIIDHAASEQHTAAVSRFSAALARSRNEPVVTYAPIARCLKTMHEKQV